MGLDVSSVWLLGEEDRRHIGLDDLGAIEALPFLDRGRRTRQSAKARLYRVARKKAASKRTVM
jgi:hypothetical protein